MKSTKNKVLKRILAGVVTVIMLLATCYVPQITSMAAELATDMDAEVTSEEIATNNDAAMEENEGISDQSEILFSDGTGNPSISYAVHSQSYGWMEQVSNGKKAGTVGQAKRLEAISIAVSSNGATDSNGNALTGGITYRTHVQSIGWQEWVYSELDGDSVTLQIDSKKYAGTTGLSKRLEAIEIELTGDLAKEYDVIYRTHVQSHGWMSWVKNGATAGTVGKSKRLEAIEIALVKKNQDVSANITYKVHGQSYSWTNEVSPSVGQVDSSTIAGSVGKSKRLEAMVINLETEGVSGGIKYSSHVQSIGWQNPVTSGQISGTEGKSKRLEAITIELTGTISSYYDIYYRVHSQKFGWLGWACNGEKAGTEGLKLRIEAVQIVLVKKGDAVPGSTANSYYSLSKWQNLPGALKIKVNKQMNCVTVYKGDFPIKAMVCTTGAATPLGNYTLNKKWRWHGLFGGYQGQYCSHITGNILFHSVPYYSANVYDLSSKLYNQLGTQASAGCIRLTVADAKWVYDNCPLKTPIIIYNSSNPGPLGKPTPQRIPLSQTWDPTDPAIKK